jgi:hypothetical protein
MPLDAERHEQAAGRLSAVEDADDLLPAEHLSNEPLNAEKWLRDMGRTQAAAILLLNMDGTVSRACDRCRSFSARAVYADSWSVFLLAWSSISR